MKDVWTDYQHGLAFIKRLINKGYHAEIWNDGTFDVISFLNDDEKHVMDIYFKPDGNFYCISGFTRGYWQDEIDWKKY